MVNVIDMRPVPEDMASLYAQLYQDIKDEAPFAALQGSAWVQEVTRVCINWMAYNENEKLDLLLQLLRNELFKMNGSLSVFPSNREDKLNVKILELGRFIQVYLTSNNALNKRNPRYQPYGTQASNSQEGIEPGTNP